VTSTLLLSGAVLIAPAYAQDAEGAEEAQTVVVTGSRIARPDLEVTSPVTVIGAEEIEQRQPNSAENLLRELPAVHPSLGPGVNNGSDRSASVNLRGLGYNRTSSSMAAA
jgi:outer membrane cobalamin receptor